jgi:hypothetical protein
MVIAYMDYLYKQGKIGDKITSKFTGIKQMSREDATFLDDATIEQARKSCRCTTLEQIINPKRCEKGHERGRWLRVKFNIEASRISSRSLRSGFVTLTAATKANDTNSSETTFSRGGWSNKSDVPRRFYDKNPRDQGALACDPKQFNSAY